MANKKYKELTPRTLEQRYQFAIITELVALNKNIEKLHKELTKPIVEPTPKPAPRKRAPAKKKPEPKEVKKDDV